MVPEGTSRNAEPKSCQLHLLAAKEKGNTKNKPQGCRRGVARCKTCNVHLCIPCFSLFHEVQDLQSITSTIISAT
eukprot:9748633-Ditylum_brightwellii.AAC.1